MILERFKVPQQDQVLVSEAALRRTVAQIFEKLGVSADDAADAADVLTMTDLRGVETHGVSNMLRAYVRDYRAGKLDPRPGWRIVRQSPATAVIDGERRLGIIVGSRRCGWPSRRRAPSASASSPCTTPATRRHRPLRDAGRPAGHGRGLLHRRRAERSCPRSRPSRCSAPTRSPSAAPARREAPMLFDAATSAIAGNKIRLAFAWLAAAAGWVTDKEATRSRKKSPSSTVDEYHQLRWRHPRAGLAQGLFFRDRVALLVRDPAGQQRRAQANGRRILLPAIAEVAASKSIGASRRAGAATAIGLVPSSGLAANVGTTLSPAPVKQTPTNVLLGGLHREVADGAEWPALYTVTTPTPTARAFSMASASPSIRTMMPSRRSPSITAVAGDCRTMRHPGRGSSLPAR